MTRNNISIWPLLAALLTSLALVSLTAPVPAAARVSHKKAIWGPLDYAGHSAFPTYSRLGVGILEWRLDWNKVATRRPLNPRDPRDPAYVWPTEIDRAVGEGRQYGIDVLLAVLGTPSWANGGRDARWAPTRAADYADFMAAAAKRYPGVHFWMIWVEPTKSQNFQPLTPDGGGRLGRSGQRGPRLYARMLDAAYVALKGVSRRNTVIGGNTFTTGTISPRNWIRALRLPGGRRPRMDLYGHNPFTARPPKKHNPPLGRGWADIYDLRVLHGWLHRYFRQRTPRVFISEFVLPTDHENWQFNFFLSQKSQARWLRASLRIARRDKRVYTFGYLGLLDQAVRPDDRQVRWGLLNPDGTPKPAFDAFRRG